MFAAGDVRKHTEYYSFCTVKSQQTFNAVGVDQLFGYTGQEWDEQARLYNYDARWYNPATGRFLSEDPVFAPNL